MFLIIIWSFIAFCYLPSKDLNRYNTTTLAPNFNASTFQFESVKNQQDFEFVASKLSSFTTGEWIQDGIFFVAHLNESFRLWKIHLFQFKSYKFAEWRSRMIHLSSPCTVTFKIKTNFELEPFSFSCNRSLSKFTLKFIPPPKKKCFSILL